MSDRTTTDLIRELQERAEGLITVALVIGFETTTEYVFAHEAPETALATLNAAITRGGEPIGFIGFVRDAPDSGRLRITALEEYAEEEWVEKYLLSLAGGVRRRIERPGAES